MTPTPPQQVDLAAIEAELQALWHSLRADAGDSGVVRTALFNWILVAPPDPAATAAMVSEVTSELPCRVLVVEIAPAVTVAPASATIGTFCRVGTGAHQQVCCEQVTLRAPASELEALASTLLALLLPDLPTVLYWPHHPQLAGGFVSHLATSLDRLVVDSATLGAGDAGLAQLRAWSLERCTVSDLAWERLDAWRELVAAIFDGAPCRERLAELRGCDVTYEPGGRHAALLAAGWLGSRLGWHPVRRQDDVWSLATSSGRLRLRVLEAAAGTPRAAAAPSLARIALDDGAGTTFVVEPDPQYPTLLAGRIERAGACPLPQRMPRTTARNGSELQAALGGPARNLAFEQALAAAAALGEMPAA